MENYTKNPTGIKVVKAEPILSTNPQGMPSGLFDYDPIYCTLISPSIPVLVSGIFDSKDIDSLKERCMADLLPLEVPSASKQSPDVQCETGLGGGLGLAGFNIGTIGGVVVEHIAQPRNYVGPLSGTVRGCGTALKGTEATSGLIPARRRRGRPTKHKASDEAEPWLDMDGIPRAMPTANLKVKPKQKARKKKFVEEDQKTEAYYEMRRKNTAAAAKCRAGLREIDIRMKLRLAYLETAYAELIELMKKCTCGIKPYLKEENNTMDVKLEPPDEFVLPKGKH